MNYRKHYDQLIARGKRTLIHGYREKHHIIPRCMGGDNSKENLVYLTAEEHFVAHQLLVKMYPNNKSLIFAANFLTTDAYGNRINNKQYSWLKSKMANAMLGNLPGNKGKKLGRDSPKKGKPGHKHREETKKKMSESHMGKPKSDSHKQAMSDSWQDARGTNEFRVAHSLRMKQWWANRKQKEAYYG